VAVNVPVETEPDVALLPDQAFEAMQLVALVLLQVRVADWPVVIDDGEALKETVGAAGVGVVAGADG
jgi:hypothetical protein